VEEGRPFLSALIQSSLPDDIFGDIRYGCWLLLFPWNQILIFAISSVFRRVAKGQELFVRSSSRKKDKDVFIDDNGDELCSSFTDSKLITGSGGENHEREQDRGNEPENKASILVDGVRGDSAKLLSVPHNNEKIINNMT
jgi:hypothetical protein